MSNASVLNPHPPEFERFLYAPVGEDRNGYAVTVLSALARLGFDPWYETENLVKLGRDAARVRLDKLLSRVIDVPALVTDHGAVARQLSLLLPGGPQATPLQQAALAVSTGRWGSSRTLWIIVALVLVLVQILFTAAPGSDE